MLRSQCAHCVTLVIICVLVHQCILCLHTSRDFMVLHFFRLSRSGDIFYNADVVAIVQRLIDVDFLFAFVNSQPWISPSSILSTGLWDRYFNFVPLTSITLCTSTGRALVTHIASCPHSKSVHVVTTLTSLTFNSRFSNVAFQIFWNDIPLFPNHPKQPAVNDDSFSAIFFLVSILSSPYRCPHPLSSSPTDVAVPFTNTLNRTTKVS